MGCESSKQLAYNVEQEYKMNKLPMPECRLFENQFEKEAFMAINLIRNSPKSFVQFVKEIKCKDCKVKCLTFCRNQVIQGKVVTETD